MITLLVPYILNPSVAPWFSLAFLLILESIEFHQFKKSLRMIEYSSAVDKFVGSAVDTHRVVYLPDLFVSLFPLTSSHPPLLLPPSYSSTLFLHPPFLHHSSAFPSSFELASNSTPHKPTNSMNACMQNAAADNPGDVTDSVVMSSGEVTLQETTSQSQPENIFNPHGTGVPQNSPSTTLEFDGHFQLPLRIKVETQADTWPGLGSCLTTGSFYQPSETNGSMFASTDDLQNFWTPGQAGFQPGFVMADPHLEPGNVDEQTVSLLLARCPCCLVSCAV